MKLLTHNMLASNVKGVLNRFPLKLQVTKVEVEENEFNEEFVKRMITKIEYGALVEAARVVDFHLPEALPAAPDSDEQFLKSLHHALININVIEGQLICPESHRVFPIVNGIPNMLLTEDEV